jgi:hypothetical protein
MKLLGMLPVKDVKPNTWNVNFLTKEEKLKLKEQMKLSGQERTPPITVRKAADGLWEIVDGEQRWSIAKELGWSGIPAVEVEVPDLDAKRLNLSYNYLRGSIDFVKLSKIVVEDKEMVQACREVFGSQETDALISSGKNLSVEAKQRLEEGLHGGAKVTPEKLKAVAETPPEHQAIMADAATKDTGLDLLKAVSEKLVQPFVPPKLGAPTPPAPLKGGGGKPEAEKEKVVKSSEVESYVECAACKQLYLLYYDTQARKVGMKLVEMKDGIKGYEEQMKLPKKYTFKCPHGGEGAIDVDTGQVTWKS